MTTFFVAYFWLLRHPFFRLTTMPLTTVDRLVGFWPESLLLYCSFWLYVPLAPALLIDRRELISYGLAAIGLSVIGMGIFLFWPTTLPQCDVDWSQHPSFAFLKSVDASGNACPSLHVAFAVFTAVWLDRLLRQLGAGRPVRVINCLWCLGILYSTLATRQHVSLDVLAGTVLGLGVATAHLWLLRTISRPLQDWNQSYRRTGRTDQRTFAAESNASAHVVEFLPSILMSDRKY
jgi:membrane-associated phospholipid phosphatase